MSFETIFETIELKRLPEYIKRCEEEKYRFVQILAINTEEGIDLLYSFMKKDVLYNYKVKGIKPEDKVPSITDKFLAAFVFENEVHDLFGVQIENIAIDFGGNFYKVSEQEPMTIITPEKKAEMEKAKKVAAAKAAKAKGQKKPDEDISEKMKDMDPEKAAKVQAALAAKKKREAEKADERDGE